METKAALNQISGEYRLASVKFGPFASAHEGYAVILEELEELKVEVFKHFEDRDLLRLRKEARQVGAMALRFMIDIT